MRLKYVLHVIGALVFCVGLTMIWPLGFSLYYGDAGVFPLLWSMLITIAVGAATFLLFRDPEAERGLSHREGMAIVGIGWLAAGFSARCRSGSAASFPAPWWTECSSPFPASPPRVPACLWTSKAWRAGCSSGAA